MDFLYLLEGIRMPVLNEFMLTVTELGGELPFLVIALIIFWCVDKHKGYYILSVGFLGTLTNQFIKLWFRIPRPWVLDPEFTILEQAREAAAGYSFPSGHTQNAVGTFGALTVTMKHKWVRIFSAALVILVPFSRMYVGVHTPKDVIVAAITAVAYLVVLHPVIFRNHGRNIPGLLAVMTVLSAGFIVFVEFWPFPADIDAHNLASGIKNAYTLFGALAGLIIVYLVDEKKLHFPTEAAWWAQILKVALGLIAVLIVKSVMKAPLNALFGGHMAATGIRYFLIVIVAGILWPLTFRWFSRLGEVGIPADE